MALTLEQLNAASASEAARWLDGLYEHSPWIAGLGDWHDDLAQFGEVSISTLFSGRFKSQNLSAAR